MSEPVKEPNFQERRKYTRIEKHFILKYFDVENPERKFLATQLKNISKGGMCLITDKPFAAGIVLGIEIKSPLFANITRMQGKVLQSHERVKGIIYETRLQFEGLSEEVEDVIKKSIEFFENNENSHE